MKAKSVCTFMDLFLIMCVTRANVQYSGLKYSDDMIQIFINDLQIRRDRIAADTESA